MASTVEFSAIKGRSWLVDLRSPRFALDRRVY